MPSVTFFTSSTSTWFSSPANSLSSVRKSLRPAHARLAQPRGAEHAAHIGVAAAWEWQFLTLQKEACLLVASVAVPDLGL